MTDTPQSQVPAQTPDPTAAAVDPAAPAPVATPAAAPATPPSGNNVMAKLNSAAELATALAQNPEVLKFMTALVNSDGPGA